MIQHPVLTAEVYICILKGKVPGAARRIILKFLIHLLRQITPLCLVASLIEFKQFLPVCHMILV